MFELPFHLILAFEVLLFLFELIHCVINWGHRRAGPTAAVGRRSAARSRQMLMLLPSTGSGGEGGEAGGRQTPVAALRAVRRLGVQLGVVTVQDAEVLMVSLFSRAVWRVRSIHQLLACTFWNI